MYSNPYSNIPIAHAELLFVFSGFTKGTVH